MGYKKELEIGLWLFIYYPSWRNPTRVLRTSSPSRLRLRSLVAGFDTGALPVIVQSLNALAR